MPEILSILQKDKRPYAEITSELGRRGESLAREFLIKNGYRIVVANFKVPVGRSGKGVLVTGEIDLIALDGETLVFAEVKTRRSDEFTPVITNVNLRKQRQIIRTARMYRRIFAIRDVGYRYDAVSVLMPKHSEPDIEITKGFWTESKFRKSRWNYRTWQDFV